MFTAFDFLALITLLVCTAMSAMRGLVAGLIALGGWIVALILARMLAVPVSDVVFSAMQPRPLAVVCAFVLVYILVRIGTVFLQYLLDMIVKTAQLSTLNRLLGGLLGAFKGVLVVSFVVLACMFSDLPQEAAWQQSFSAPFFEEIARLAIPYLPDFLAEQLLMADPQGQGGSAAPLPSDQPPTE